MQGIAKVIRIHPIEIMNVCIKFHENPSSILQYSLKSVPRISRDFCMNLCPLIGIQACYLRSKNCGSLCFQTSVAKCQRK